MLVMCRAICFILGFIIVHEVMSCSFHRVKVRLVQEHEYMRDILKGINNFLIPLIAASGPQTTPASKSIRPDVPD